MENNSAEIALSVANRGTEHRSADPRKALRGALFLLAKNATVPIATKEDIQLNSVASENEKWNLQLKAREAGR